MQDNGVVFRRINGRIVPIKRSKMDRVHAVIGGPPERTLEVSHLPAGKIAKFGALVGGFGASALYLTRLNKIKRVSGGKAALKAFSGDARIIGKAAGKVGSGVKSLTKKALKYPRITGATAALLGLSLIGFAAKEKLRQTDI